MIFLVFYYLLDHDIDYSLLSVELHDLQDIKNMTILSCENWCIIPKQISTKYRRHCLTGENWDLWQLAELICILEISGSYTVSVGLCSQFLILTDWSNFFTISLPRMHPLGLSALQLFARNLNRLIHFPSLIICDALIGQCKIQKMQSQDCLLLSLCHFWGQFLSLSFLWNYFQLCADELWKVVRSAGKCCATVR